MLCFSGPRLFMMKPLIHVLASLTLWAFAVFLLFKEKGEFVSNKLDFIRTYQLQKVPRDYDYTRLQTVNPFKSLWTTAGVCMGNFSAVSNDGTCNTKRQAMVTYVRGAYSCDKYRSPYCNCLNQVLKTIADDITSSSSGNLPGTFQTLNGGTFQPYNNLAGKQDQIIEAMDACHYLHHPTLLAQETSTTWLRRSFLLFFLTTVITGSAVHQFFVLPLARHGWFNGWESFARFLGVLIFPIVGAGVTVGLDTSSGILIYYIIGPPLVLLIWYEFLLPHLHNDPFIHPYHFSVVLCLLQVIALVENGVLDHDVIYVEIWKQHIITCLYFGTCWFYLFSGGNTHARHSYYNKKPAQETIYLSVALSIMIASNTILAPYGATSEVNVLWWLPSILVFTAFAAVVWINELDRFSELYVSDTGKNEANQRVINEQDLERSTYYITNGSLVVSMSLIFIMALVVFYYWRDYSMVLQSIWEVVPTTSIQVSWKAPWLTPNFA